jgi:hypothetical protein
VNRYPVDLRALGRWGRLLLHLSPGTRSVRGRVRLCERVEDCGDRRAALRTAVVLGERPRREQVAGAAVAFAGLAVIGIDRVASAPILPFVLVVGAAAAWGVSNTLTRMAQPPDALALLVWASLVAPLPLLGLSFAFEGQAEIGDPLAATLKPPWQRAPAAAVAPAAA